MDTPSASSPQKPAYLPVASISHSWIGWSGVRNLVILGDSYSSSGFRSQSVWVDHIATQQPEMHIHNYALPGHTADEDLEGQMNRFLADHSNKPLPEAEPALDSTSTLYVLWIGINDCGTLGLDNLNDVTNKVLHALHYLYTDAAARHFLLIDVPPLGRSPAGAFSSKDISPRYLEWNDLLISKASTFADEYSLATVFVYSMHKLLGDILHDPEEYGFTEGDATKPGWGIWADVLHLTSAVHSIIADGIMSALS